MARGRRAARWALLLAMSRPVHAQQPLVISHVTIVDGSDPAPRRDQTVVLRGSRIVAVGPAQTTPAPAGARVVDGRGKFLIPGLWDMHVHLDVPAAAEVLPLYVRNGVTGVRDMGGSWSVLTGLRAAVHAGALAGPRIIAAGPYLDGNDQPIAHLRVRNPAEAVIAVDSLARLGVDLIKFHTGLTREAFFAAAREARRKGMSFSGHVPRVVGAADASDSGMKSIEHLLTIPTPCTPAESLALQPRYPVQGALGRCSSEDGRPLYARLVRNGTWVTPTFVAQFEVAQWPRRDVPGDAYARALPDTLRKYVAWIFPMPDDVPPGADSVGIAVFRKRLALLGTMYGAGVGVLAGTDAPLRNSPPGFGLHEELALLVQAGLTPFQALRAATLDAARYLGMGDSLGTVQPGRLADLVLLEANPLDNIRNTRRIGLVFANGKALTP